jgi:hypothetical protein
MRRCSQGLDAHFRKHIHLEAGNIPTVATPRRSLLGAATYSPDESIGTGPALAPTENMASTHSQGGRIPPEAMAATNPAGGRHTADDDNVPDNDTGRTGMANPCPAGGRPVPDNDAGTQLDFGLGVAPLADSPNRRLAAALRQRLDAEFGATPLAVTPPAGRPHPAPPTVMGPFVAAIANLPDLEQPVDSYIWRKTFLQHARQADAALADFHRELDDRVRPINTLRESCADLKDSCANLHTTVTATFSTLALLVALMGSTHKRVSTLEAATARNEADVAAATAAHASTTTVVAEIGSVVTEAVDDRVGRHIGSLKSDVSSLGQDVLALRTLLATMHGTPAPTAPDGTVTPLKPPADCAAPPLEGAQSLDSDDTPTPAAPGTPRPTNKMFPYVDSTNLRVDITQHDQSHTRPAVPPFPPGGRHDDDAASSDGGQWLRVGRLRVGSKIGLNAHLNLVGHRRPTPLDRHRPIPTVPPNPTSRAPTPTSLRCLETRITPHSVWLFPPPVILTAAAKLPMLGSASSTLRCSRTLNITVGATATTPLPQPSFTTVVTLQSTPSTSSAATTRSSWFTSL